MTWNATFVDNSKIINKTVTDIIGMGIPLEADNIQTLKIYIKLNNHMEFLRLCKSIIRSNMV